MIFRAQEKEDFFWHAALLPNSWLPEVLPIPIVCRKGCWFSQLMQSWLPGRDNQNINHRQLTSSGHF